MSSSIFQIPPVVCNDQSISFVRQAQFNTINPTPKGATNILTHGINGYTYLVLFKLLFVCHLLREINVTFVAWLWLRQKRIRIVTALSKGYREKFTKSNKFDLLVRCDENVETNH